MTKHKIRKRKIAEVVRDLRQALNLTQQDLAVALNWSISTAVRFEHGARPGLKSMTELLGMAEAKDLDALAAELRLHLNARLGPDFPLSPDDPQEKLCVLLARRINQDPKRREAFIKFARPEMQQLLMENEIRKDHELELWAGLDAWTERQKAREKKQREGKTR